MSEPTWEPVTPDGSRLETTMRLPVPGGWIYRVRESGEGGLALAMVFVPEQPK